MTLDMHDYDNALCKVRPSPLDTTPGRTLAGRQLGLRDMGR